ncbi:MAG TPA: hypothetical protein VFG73_07685 [Rhodanobacteraceae bacterium]|nr:hypothetical protein [Rhodanobacteraceae bacterium]
MKRRMLCAIAASSAVLGLAGCATQPSQTAQENGIASATIDCRLTYSLTGWAALVKHASGKGLVTCNDGSSAPVTITAHGGGLTVGKYHIDDGHGNFTGVHDIDQVYGEYVQGEVHAGATQSGSAQVLTKGTVSLALTGTGQGIGIGVAVGVMDIEPANGD